MMYYALVDCNNFYASCEQLFSPKLKGKPLAVLSNNDGCIIARSAEAKRLGIPMGAPIFQYRSYVEKGHLHVLSSNFALYGDLSKRVMDTLKTFQLDTEIYSIDEAFLSIQCPSKENTLLLTNEIRSRVMQWTGIPISIGIAKTKTLAKLANAIAKQDPLKEGIYLLDNEQEIDQLLEKTPVEKIWGIGSRLRLRMQKKQIFFALQLKNSSDLWIKKHFSKPILQTVYELRQQPCISLETVPPSRKSITCSRSFSGKLDLLEDIQSAVAHFATIAGEKLRKQRLLANMISVFLITKGGAPSYDIAHIQLPSPTAFTPHLINYAKQLTQSLFKNGISYKKAGILLNDLISQNHYQADIFTSHSQSTKETKAMDVMDKINKQRKAKSLVFGSQKVSDKWKHIPSNKTARFTTRWEELLIVGT